MPFQAKLTTKLNRYSIGDTVLELSETADKSQLNQIVKNVLKQSGDHDESELNTITFEFIVGGRFLQSSVDKHVKIYADDIDADEILSEKLVEIEYLISPDPPKPLQALPHDDWVSCVDANDSYFISGSYDNSLRIFSINDCKHLATIPNAHKKPITKICWLKDVEAAKANELYFISSGHDELVIMRKFNTKTMKTDVVTIYKGHNRSVNCIDCSEDLIASGSYDKSLRIWNTRSNEGDESEPGEEIKEKKSKKKQKVKSSDKSVVDSTAGAILTLTGHQESITGVKFLNGCDEYKSVASCSIDKTICIWDIEVGDCKRKFLSAKPLLGIDYCAENNLFIAASCDRHVRAFDARAPDNATAKVVFQSHSLWVSSVAFGTESKNNFITGGYDNLVKLWDLRSPKTCLYDLIGHHDKVLDVNWKNPSYMLSGSADASVKIFVNK